MLECQRDMYINARVTAVGTANVMNAMTSPKIRRHTPTAGRIVSWVSV